MADIERSHRRDDRKRYPMGTRGGVTIEAVVLYERARTTRLLRGVRADVGAVEHAEHRALTPDARRKMAALDQRNP